MNSQSVFQLKFSFLTSKPTVVEPSAAQVSSDAGLLPFRQLDQQIGLSQLELYDYPKNAFGEVISLQVLSLQ